MNASPMIETASYTSAWNMPSEQEELFEQASQKSVDLCDS